MCFFCRYSYSELSESNVTVSLQIYGVQPSDEGVYVCVAENSGGSASANVSLRVLIRERSTVEPPFESQGAGFAAAIAAGALVGTLLALGCLFFSIFFYAKKLKNRKKNAKAPIAQTSIIPPSILKNTEHSGVGKDSTLKSQQHTHQQQYQQHHSTYSERGLNLNTAAILENQEFGEIAYQGQLPPSHKYFIEPDLINEVPPETMGNFGYAHQVRDHRMISEFDPGYTLQPRSNYLDKDGYPLNFGLPKLSLRSPVVVAGTLPRIRQRHVEGSAVLPPTRYSREAEFLARSSGYDVVMSRNDLMQLSCGPYVQTGHQSLDTEYQNMAASVEPDNTPFIPSPPAAYKSEPAALSPRSLLSKTALEAAAVANARAESVESLEHPESPDEGYVGDAMDV